MDAIPSAPKLFVSRLEIDAAVDVDVVGIDRWKGRWSREQRGHRQRRDTRQGSQLNHMNHPTSRPTTHSDKKEGWQY